jgi:hypothetical protein
MLLAAVCLATSCRLLGATFVAGAAAASRARQPLWVDPGPAAKGETPPPLCGPVGGQSADAWGSEMIAFRHQMRAGSIAGGTPGSFCNASDFYGRNEWAQHTFVCPQSGLYDRLLYDRETHTWTVERFLADLDERYGGIDCVLLWQSYTNMGVDARNQIDLLRVAPGGVAGLTKMIGEFHAANVSVLFPWNQVRQRSSPPTVFTRECTAHCLFGRFPAPERCPLPTPAVGCELYERAAGGAGQQLHQAAVCGRGGRFQRRLGGARGDAGQPDGPDTRV